MKLHELLAVNNSLDGQATKCRTDLLGTFEKKRHLFEEKIVTFIPSEEGAATTVENVSSIQTTVNAELNGWLRGHLVKSLDASYQVNETNTEARANIILEDGTIVAEHVPATALLELEKSIAEIGALVAAIPTLDPAKGFTADTSRVNQFKARDVTKTRTKKVREVLVKYQATKEHPAQTEMIDVDKPVGILQEQEWSGLITPAQKSELINRTEVLGRAVRQARARANDATVDTAKRIGAKLVNFVFGTPTTA
jgi:hypothetical protein